ncbi:hypothetical protein WJX84_001413 [Apatococcus fuscideae]|uniref:Uncharacterized protein n=1 Tax=Apatococcus fuscideae TaxID=2026836 RepID=A0AAW1SS57_9CHLO
MEVTLPQEGTSGLHRQTCPGSEPGCCSQLVVVVTAQDACRCELSFAKLGSVPSGPKSNSQGPVVTAVRHATRALSGRLPTPTTLVKSRLRISTAHGITMITRHHRRFANSANQM